MSRVRLWTRLPDGRPQAVTPLWRIGSELYNQLRLLHFQPRKDRHEATLRQSARPQESGQGGLSGAARNNCVPTATEISTCRWICRTAPARSGRGCGTPPRRIYRSFENGDYVRVEGTTQLFQGAMQLILTRIAKVEPSEVNEDDFTPLPAVEVDKSMVRLAEILRTHHQSAPAEPGRVLPHGRSFMGKFGRAPAGIKHHHAYRGGLLEHVVNLMEVVLRIAPCYPHDRPRSAADRAPSCTTSARSTS